MEDTHRKLIIKNIGKLIRVTDYDKLMNGCVNWGLLTPIMRNIIESFEPPELCSEQVLYERHKRLLHKLTQRGPTAYQKLMQLLANLEYNEAVALLNEDVGFHSIHPRNDENDMRDMREKRKALNSTDEDSNDDDTAEKQDKLKIYTQNIEPKTPHTVIKSKYIKIHPKIGVYPMRSQNNRGVFFMVNIIDFPDAIRRRNGAEEDGESLLYLFKELGFKLFAYVNLTKSQFFDLLDKIINSEHTRQAECFVMALMSHGESPESIGVVEFHDGSVSKVREIEDRFENHRCPNLTHKPKILIFPFCRGEISDRGHLRKVQTDSISDTEPCIALKTIPTFSDILICYASTRGFRSHREDSGSWYIQKFCEIMSLHAHDMDFEDIVKLIQAETGKLRSQDGQMQTGSFENIGFNKKLFFNPGAYETEE